MGDSASCSVGCTSGSGVQEEVGKGDMLAEHPEGKADPTSIEDPASHEPISLLAISSTNPSLPPKCVVCGRSKLQLSKDYHEWTPFSQSDIGKILRVHSNECHLCESCLQLVQRLDYHQAIALDLKEALQACIHDLASTASNASAVPSLPCPLCGASVPGGGRALADHLHLHLHDWQLPCSRCGRRLSGWRALRRHVLAVHQGALLSRCARCPAAFRTSAQLEPHRLSQHGAAASPRRFHCSVCPRRFTSPHRFCAHLEHHGALAEPLLQRTLTQLRVGQPPPAPPPAPNALNPEESIAETCELGLQTENTESAKDKSEDAAVEETAARGADLRLEINSGENQNVHIGTNEKSLPAGSAAPNADDSDFHCPHCGKVFKRKQSFERHVDAVHKPPGSYRCDKCEKTFSIKFYWQKHVNRHREKSLHCDNCQRSFVNPRALARHKCLSAGHSAAVRPEATSQAVGQQATGDVRFSDIGPPSRADTALTTSHRDADSAGPPRTTGHRAGESADGQPVAPGSSEAGVSAETVPSPTAYLCGSCGRSFATSAALHRHSRQHAEPTFQCSVCGKCFRWKNNLDVHARMHAGERPYQCDVCGHATRCSANLRLHKQRVHSDVRPHVCTFCQKAFKERHSLAIHVRSHTGQRPYVCERCGDGFVTKGKLNSHMSKHSEERPHACPLCQRPLKTAAILGKHCRRVHGATAAEAARRAEQQRTLAAAPLLGDVPPPAAPQYLSVLLPAKLG